MSRLVDRIRGEDRPGAMPNGTYFGGQRIDPSGRCAAGIVIDGVITPLEGEPPPAVSKGWGDLTFLYYPHIDY